MIKYGDTFARIIELFYKAKSLNQGLGAVALPELRKACVPETMSSPVPLCRI